MENKRTKCEVWARVVGYIRPLTAYNPGKLAEYKDRKVYNVRGKDDRKTMD